MRVAFLFNAQFHQILHALPIALRLAIEHRDIEVTMLAPSDTYFDFIGRYLPPGTQDALRFTRLASPAWVSLYRALSGDLSVAKKAMLRHNKALLAGFDALVVPERTSAYVKSIGLTALQLIHTGHGAGDRERSFNPAIQAFDLVLLSGRKYEQRLLQSGLIRAGHYAVIGYPKFDLLLNRPTQPASRALFANDRPTVLYAPHFDPKISSWPRLGVELLEFMLHQDAYNLIFAPHVRLFDPPSARKRRRFRRYAEASNILIDLGSDRSIDMSYTNAADIYVGDSSSQIYEFIARPRPCVFLNAHGVDWSDDPFHLCWTCGPVIDRVQQLPEALANARERSGHYRAEQERVFRHTFDLGPMASSTRAAAAIATFLQRFQASTGGREASDRSDGSTESAAHARNSRA